MKGEKLMRTRKKLKTFDKILIGVMALSLCMIPALETFAAGNTTEHISYFTIPSKGTLYGQKRNYKFAKNSQTMGIKFRGKGSADNRNKNEVVLYGESTFINWSVGRATCGESADIIWKDNQFLGDGKYFFYFANNGTTRWYTDKDAVIMYAK